MLTTKRSTLQNPLDALGQVEPTASQRRVQGHNAVTKQPRDKLRRLVTRQVVEHQQHPQRRQRTGQGGFLDQIDTFDPQFFGISSRLATIAERSMRLCDREI